MGGVECCVVEEEVAGEGFGVWEALVAVVILFLGMGFGAGGWVERWRRTLGVELENVDVAVRVRDGDVELFVRREECCYYHFDRVGRFAEEAELVGILLCPT